MIPYSSTCQTLESNLQNMTDFLHNQSATVNEADHKLVPCMPGRAGSPQPIRGKPTNHHSRGNAASMTSIVVVALRERKRQRLHHSAAFIPRHPARHSAQLTRAVRLRSEIRFSRTPLPPSSKLYLTNPRQRGANTLATTESLRPAATPNSPVSDQGTRPPRDTTARHHAS